MKFIPYFAINERKNKKKKKRGRFSGNDRRFYEALQESWKTFYSVRMNWALSSKNHYKRATYTSILFQGWWCATFDMNTKNFRAAFLWLRSFFVFFFVCCRWCCCCLMDSVFGRCAFFFGWKARGCVFVSVRLHCRVRVRLCLCLCPTVCAMQPQLHSFFACASQTTKTCNDNKIARLAWRTNVKSELNYFNHSHGMCELTRTHTHTLSLFSILKCIQFHFRLRCLTQYCLYLLNLGIRDALTKYAIELWL